MIGGDSMDKDKELELLMDIQEKVGRIDERLKKVEDTDRKAEEAIRLSEKNEEKILASGSRQRRGVSGICSNYHAQSVSDDTASVADSWCCTGN